MLIQSPCCVSRWRKIDLRRQITRLCRGHVLTILRKVGGTATTVASVYVAVTRDDHYNKLGDLVYTRSVDSSTGL